MSSSTKGRNFRRRGDNDDEDNEDKSAAAAAAASKPSSSKPKKKPSSLLSFADDGNEEESTKPSPRKSKEKPSRLTKPSSAHKIITTKDRHGHSPMVSNVQPQAGTYTKEALLELQKNTRTLLAPSSRASSTSSEPRFVLKGLLKPKSPESDAKQRSDDSFRKDKDNAESRLASMDIDKEADSSFYPDMDKAAIEAIRAKRERMRLSGLRTAAPDYISLDAGSNHEVAADDLSDDEEAGPLFGGSARKGVFDVVEERAIGGVPRKEPVELPVDDEEDEEEKLWEEEQFRKGLGKRIDESSGRITSSDNSVMVHVMQQQRQPETRSYGSAAVYGLVPGTTSVPPIGGASRPAQESVVPMAQQAEVARKALEDNLKRLKESHGRTVSSLKRTDESLSNSLDEIARLENSLSVASEKFIFMQKLRDFVSVICAFLQHKAPLIEELEEHMQKVNEECASAIIERRNTDNDDQMSEVDIAVKAAMSVFSQYGNSGDMIKDAANAAQAASKAAKEKVNLPVKLDEFGRDLNQQKRFDIERRAQVCQHRKARFDSKRVSSMEIDHLKVEGESSTDESDSESPAYQSHIEQLLQTANEIFSDASDEYSQLSLVKNRFERWKKDYPSVYRDAYMSKVILDIFSPYVRIELLKWDPLHEDADFSDMKWHLLLFDYGLPVDKGQSDNDEDEDLDLIPTLVEKVALPILHHEISRCWDMLSSRETKNGVSATCLVIDYLPASSKALAELLVAVRTRLADAVSKIMVPTWSSLVLKAVPNAAQHAAYRFGMSVRLLRNICLWKEVLALPVLERLALDELLYGKILPHLQNITSDIHDAVRRTERAIASLSGVWTGTSVTKDQSHKLQPLVDYVLLLRKTLERRAASGMAESETGGLARRLVKMLTELNQYDIARDTAKTFRIREAL